MAPTPEELRRQKKEAAKEVIDVLQEIALLLVRTPSVVLLWIHIGCWARGWDRVYLTFAALVLVPEIFLGASVYFFFRIVAQSVKRFLYPISPSVLCSIRNSSHSMLFPRTSPFALWALRIRNIPLPSFVFPIRPLLRPLLLCTGSAAIITAERVEIAS